MALDFVTVSEQRIDLPSFDQYFDTGMKVTFTAWCIFDNDDAGEYVIIGNTGDYQSGSILWRAYQNKISFLLSDGTVVIGLDPIVKDTLYLLTVVWDIGTSVKLYHNITEDYSASYTRQITADTGNMVIGAWLYHINTTWYGYFDGKIGDVRFYNRALSPAEIKSIYNSRGSDNIVNGLVGRWLMNEKTDGGTATVASSVIDISKEGNHGTPVNSPVYRVAPIELVKPMGF